MGRRPRRTSLLNGDGSVSCSGLRHDAGDLRDRDLSRQPGAGRFPAGPRRPSLPHRARAARGRRRAVRFARRVRRGAEAPRTRRAVRGHPSPSEAGGASSAPAPWCSAVTAGRSRTTATDLRRALRDADARLHAQQVVAWTPVAQPPASRTRTAPAIAACIGSGLLLIVAGEFMYGRGSTAATEPVLVTSSPAAYMKAEPVDAPAMPAIVAEPAPERLPWRRRRLERRCRGRPPSFASRRLRASRRGQSRASGPSLANVRRPSRRAPVGNDRQRPTASGPASWIACASRWLRNALQIGLTLRIESASAPSSLASSRAGRFASRWRAWRAAVRPAPRARTLPAASR